MSSFTETELLRAVSQMVIVANVLEVDTGAARARVSFGPGTQSAWLPWMTERASAISVWGPPSVGEQVVCLSPAGATERAIILGAIFSGENPALSSTDAEYRLTVGGSSIVIRDDQLVLSCGGSVLEMSADGIKLGGSRIDLN